MYEVDTDGRVFSKYKNRYMNPSRHKNGYLFVDLFVTSKIHKVLSVHRLIAKAFIPNPKNLPCVNHKDENPSNNSVDNLEWCTHKYNSNYGTCIERRVAHTDYSSEIRKITSSENGKKLSKPVLQYSKDGVFIAEYKSTMDVEREFGYNNSHISACAIGHRKSAYGFIWRYKRKE